jgi:alkyldihydroxyacetonephosphate synthase
MPERKRRWNGWGYEGESFVPPPRLVRWLDGRLGRGEALAETAEASIAIPPPRAFPLALEGVVGDPAIRLRAACGMSFPDLVALRTGGIEAFPDGVVSPASAAQVVEVLRAAAYNGVTVIVRGGGTSVVGGVTVRRHDRPVLVLSLERLEGLIGVDPVSGYATFSAGTYGPVVEAALSGHGLRLGHEPQSFELSTVGGWIAARSAGQRSTGIGRIESLLAGVELATAHGLWRMPAQPASAAGPDLRQLVLGSEGRLGVITAATLRVRERPEAEDGVSVLLPSWSAGVELARELLQGGVAVEVLRLSDPAESSMALAVLHLPDVARQVLGWLLERRRRRNACLLLLGFAGATHRVRAAMVEAGRLWRERGGTGLGRWGWSSWRRDRFRHPYLRDALLSLGWGLDTLETAAPWGTLPALYDRVREALAASGRAGGFVCQVLCHLSHAYRDGASLYYTFIWPLRRGSESDDWRRLKVAATEALLEGGGTLTHHHGVGTMHAPWLGREIGDQGVALLRASVTAADPSGTLNPGVLETEGPC